jgi:heme/copper-type cytochrome/quinol oxidase subunit 4
MEKLQGIGLIILAIIAAWLVFRVVKKIVLAIITILILGAVALFVYFRYF